MDPMEAIFQEARAITQDSVYRIEKFKAASSSVVTSYKFGISEETEEGYFDFRHFYLDI